MLAASSSGGPTALLRGREVLDADLAAETGARVDDRGESLRGAEDAVHRGAADGICRRGGGAVRRRAGHRAVAEDDARARGENADLRRSTARVTAGEPPTVRHLGTVRKAAIAMAVAGDEAGGGTRRHHRQNPQNPDESPRDPHAAMVAPCSSRIRVRNASRRPADRDPRMHRAFALGQSFIQWRCASIQERPWTSVVTSGLGRRRADRGEPLALIRCSRRTSAPESIDSPGERS
jgi:hypothetical protein